jgi:hypothetical protein
MLPQEITHINNLISLLNLKHQSENKCCKFLFFLLGRKNQQRRYDGNQSNGRTGKQPLTELKWL